VSSVADSLNKSAENRRRTLLEILASCPTWLADKDADRPLTRAEGWRTGPRARARPGGAHELGSVTEARVRHRRRTVRVRWPAEDLRRDRRSGGDREDPHAPGLGRAGAAARTGAGAFAQLRSLIREHDDGCAQPRDRMTASKCGG
jgi:hypothetical protein